MYAGHFASALALKTVKPEAPTWALVAGAGLLDLLFGWFVAFGIEGAMPDWRTSHLLNIPWSHSLLMTAVWGGGFALLFRARGLGVMMAVLAAVVSHWFLDVFVHRPDMELWPNSTIRLGFSNLFGPVSGWAESVLVVGASTLYALRARVADQYGRHWIAVCAVMIMFWGLGFLSR